jgi:hypothetical protein
MRLLTRPRNAIAVSIAALAALTGVLFTTGVFASTPDPTTSPTGLVYACSVMYPSVSKSVPFLNYHGPWTGQSCGAGHQLVVFNAGSSIPTGPQGPAGASAVVTVTASTNVVNWPETSGWATDAFLRSVTVTRDHAADNSHCNSAAACWFYTFTLTDTGSFQTVDGKPTPNGTGGTISGVSGGTMQGTAVGSFYADSDAPAAANVPATANGDSKPASTTAWATLTLPGSAHTFGVKLTAYGWTYADTATCEQWVDQITPGDDGQSAGDGNITGSVHCS